MQSSAEGFLWILGSRIKMFPEVATALHESGGPRKPPRSPRKRKQAGREVLSGKEDIIEVSEVSEPHRL